MLHRAILLASGRKILFTASRQKCIQNFTTGGPSLDPGVRPFPALKSNFEYIRVRFLLTGPACSLKAFGPGFEYKIKVRSCEFKLMRDCNFIGGID